MSAEQKLKDYILTKYKSILEFSKIAGMPYSTIDSIFKRGIRNANVQNIIKLCDKLNIKVEPLFNGEIIDRDTDLITNEEKSKKTQNTNILKLNDFTLSQEEKELIIAFREFSSDYKLKVTKLIEDVKTEIEKDKKLDMLMRQNQELMYGRAVAYGGETAEAVLTPEDDAKIDEYIKQEQERIKREGDDIL